jgi:hypothetical protein
MAPRTRSARPISPSSHCNELREELDVSCCADLNDEYPLAVSDIDDLGRRVEKISVDSMRWLTVYRCRVCGQYWNELYVERGHGELPYSWKIPPPADTPA